MSKLIPDRFEDIVALMALFRPGPLGSGMVDDYIERKHKQRAISFAHPSLKETLQDTYGVIVYQEQVMQTAQLIADYTLGEADLLRRAMGKKLTAEMAKHKSRFVGGAEKKRTLSKSRAASLFETIQKFAEYGFNKSHAAAYAIISYRTAYYKAHYPSAFLAAAMSCEARNTDGIRLLIADARKRSIEVLPPDINRDGAHFFLRIRAASTTDSPPSKASVKKRRRKLLKRAAIRRSPTYLTFACERKDELIAPP